MSSALRPETDVGGCATRNSADSRRRARALPDVSPSFSFEIQKTKILLMMQLAFLAKIKRGACEATARSFSRQLLALCRSECAPRSPGGTNSKRRGERSPRLLGWRDHAPARRAHRRPTAIAGVNRRSAARGRREATAKRGATVEMPRLEAAATVVEPFRSRGREAGERARSRIRDRAVAISETGAGATTAGMGMGAMAGGTFEGDRWCRSSA